tara:strand:+ start:1215 stop:1316 length:102 start_codon:yes stop_codon:yes gene_type:complete
MGGFACAKELDKAALKLMPISMVKRALVVIMAS